MPEPADAIRLREVDQARTDFAAIEGDLQFIMGRLARLPSRAWLSLIGLIGLAACGRYSRSSCCCYHGKARS